MNKLNVAPSSLSNNFFDSLHGSISVLTSPATNYLTTQWASSVPNFGILERRASPDFHSLPAEVEAARINKSAQQDGYRLLKEPDQASLLTTWEAYTTCINMYVGMSLLSMGYAVMIGGYMQVITLACVMIVGNYTGLLMVACFERFPDTDISYEKLGGFAMGMISPRLRQVGVMMVAVSVTVEFVGVSSIAYVFLFRHAFMLFSEWFEFRDVVIVCTAISFPTVFALNFSEMTIWSLVGTITPFCVVAACISIFLLNLEKFHDHDYTPFRFEGTGISAGIFLFALGGHAALPSVYNSMQRKEDFPFMVRSVFISMFILYGCVAFSCLMTFGSETDVLITENYATWPGGAVITSLIILMLMKTLSVIPANVNMICEIPENIMGVADKPRWKRLVRSSAFAITCVIGYFMRDDLDVLEAITGASFTMLTSVVFPILIYIIVCWKDISVASRIFNILLFFIFIGLNVWFTKQSFDHIGNH